jgi:ATP-binding cassette subfamily B protein
MAQASVSYFNSSSKMIKSFTSKVQKFRSNLNIQRVLQLIWTASPKWTTISVSFILVESALFYATFYLGKLLINALSEHNPDKAAHEHTVVQYLIYSVICAVLYATIKAVSSYITEKQSVKVSEFVDEKIHTSAIGLDLSFYESPEYFDILKRAKDMGSERPNIIVATIIEIAKNGITLLLIGSLLVSIDWKLFPILALFIIPTLWVKISFADSQNRLRLAQTALERKSNYFSTLLTSDIHAKEVRSFGLGEYIRKMYTAIRIQLFTGRLKISKQRTYREVISSFIATLGFFCCIAYIAIGSLRGITSIGDITVFIVAFPQSFSVLQSLSSNIATLYHNNIFVKSIFELFDLQSGLAEAEHPLPIPNIAQIDLDLKNINFTYPHADAPTLTNINLKMPAGKIIAIVGSNGAGKSTLIKLLCRLYDPTSGEITLNGENIKHFKSTDYQKQICAVFQDFGKYNVSVADNIRFGDIHTDRPHADIVEAAKNSGANLFIDQFPAGYDTTMGRIFEDGHEVSIGQWQKLAIARAFYSSSRFIVLDEATSALDAMSEKGLFDSLRERIGNRAALIISHRQSAVKHADYIYMLTNGTISESGTHDELVKLKGYYYNLFNDNSTAD